jgi:hypothetical protein
MADKTRLIGRATPAVPAGRPPMRHGSRPARRPRPQPTSRLPGSRSASSTTQQDGQLRQILIGLAAALTIGAGGLTGHLWPRAHRPQASCVVAIDAQGSSAPQVKYYKNWLPDQLIRCAEADRAVIEVMLINGETSTNPTRVRSLDLSKLHYVGNANDDKQTIETAIKHYASSAMTEILAAPNSSVGTDLVATGCAARPQLRAVVNTLIIFSDGDNSRPPLVFGKNMPMDKASIAGYIDRLRSSGQICNLHGATVDWYGAGVGGGSNALSGILGPIQDFWSAYFDASQAHLIDYQANP